MSTGSGLIIDIIALGVIVLSTVLGARKGFALTVVSFMQWFVCVILGFILCGTAKSFLMDYTELDDTIHDGVLSHIQSAVSESSTSLALPDLFHDWIDDNSGRRHCRIHHFISDDSHRISLCGLYHQGDLFRTYTAFFPQIQRWHHRISGWIFRFPLRDCKRADSAASGLCSVGSGTEPCIAGPFGIRCKGYGKFLRGKHSLR